LDTIGEFQEYIIGQIKATSDSPTLDAQVLIAHVVEKNRTWVVTHPEVILDQEKKEELFNKSKRLISGEPLPYIIGHWEFYGLDFLVNNDVLIPRPETELLVEKAINWLESHTDCRTVVDVGAGSGCIAISLKKYFPYLDMIACDISLPALRLAKKNAEKHHLSDGIKYIQSDLLTAIKQEICLVCANLPYIPQERINFLSVSKYEPRLALDGGIGGLEQIEKLLQQCAHLVLPGGFILLEIESSQGESVIRLAKKNLPGSYVHVFYDYAGKARILQIEKIC